MCLLVPSPSPPPRFCRPSYGLARHRGAADRDESVQAFARKRDAPCSLEPSKPGPGLCLALGSFWIMVNSALQNARFTFCKSYLWTHAPPKARAGPSNR